MNKMANMNKMAIETSDGVSALLTVYWLKEKLVIEDLVTG